MNVTNTSVVLAMANRLRLSLMRPAVAAALALPILQSQRAAASVLLNESFSRDEYVHVHKTTDGTLAQGSLAGVGATDGFFSSSWNTGSSTANAVFALDNGLAFPAGDFWSGFAAEGASAGWCRPDSVANITAGGSSNYRMAARSIASGHYPTSGKFYFRTLVQQGAGAGAATPKQGAMRGIGLRNNASVTDYGRTESGNAFTNGLWFAFHKTSDSSSDADTELDVCFGGERVTLVTSSDFAEGETYLCVAEVEIDADGDMDALRAFAVPVSSWSGVQSWPVSINANAVSTESPLANLVLQGPFQTGSKYVSFDEITIATELSDVVPLAAIQVDISATLAVTGVDGSGRAQMCYAATVTGEYISDGRSVNLSETHATQANFGNARTNPIGTATESGETKTFTPGNYPWGQTYYWYVTGQVLDSDGETVLAEITTPTNTLKVVYPGNMYVSTDGSATMPYDTIEKASRSIATALENVTDGGTIFIADGVYEIDSQIVVEKNVRIEGLSGNPEKVVIRNIGTGAANRCLSIREGYADAVVSSLTFENGHRENGTGGNLWIAAGLVTNCISRGGVIETTSDNTAEHSGAGIYIRNADVVDCVFSNNTIRGVTQKDLAIAMQLQGVSKVQNCLFVANDSDLEAAVIRIDGMATMDNCTIVKTILGEASETYHGSSALKLMNGQARVRNCVMAGVVDAQGNALGAVGPVTATAGGGTPDINSQFDYCASDVEFDAEARPTWVYGTATGFFVDYAGGDYRPKGALRNRGGSPLQPLPATDLAGKPRQIGMALDIGCYEFTPLRTVLIFN